MAFRAVYYYFGEGTHNQNKPTQYLLVFWKTTTIEKTNF